MAEFLFGLLLPKILRSHQKNSAASIDRMCHTKSPAKILRDVKKMARFNDKQKAKSKEILTKMSITTNSSIDIPPRENHLSTVRSVAISISPEKPATRSLSFTKPIMTDLPPDPLPCFYCDLVCPKPNLPDTPTSPYEVCYICLKPLCFFARDPMECCGSIFHENCWGEHQCKRLL